MSNNIEPDIQINNDNQPYKEPGALLKFIGILWSLHVLLAALLYPSFLLPNDHSSEEENIKKESLFANVRVFFGTFILFFNIFCIVVLFTRSTLIDAAKVLFVLGTWIAVGIIYILFNHFRDIYYVLSALEDDAIQSRDQSVMVIRAGQAALRAGNLKLAGQGEVEQFSFGHLVKKIGPLALLIMQKTNMKTLLIEGLKLALSGTVLGKFL